ncbi:TPR-like protein [Serendipita vermifera]|nr:TPR-like protein [Serendipita vermifera]
MSVLVLKDTTVELLTRDDEALKGITHLVLEVDVYGRVVDKANLVSQATSPWKWDADQLLVIRHVATDFMISVVTESDRDERRVIASMELSGLELCNTIGNQYEVPLISDESYPNLVLRTSAMAIEDIGDLVARSGLNDIRGGLSHTERTIEKLLADSNAAYEDFIRHGKLDRLEQAISQYRAAIEVIPEDDPQVPDILNNLGISLRRRFEQVGCLDDINEAIERHEIAIILRPDDDSDKSGRLINLGGALFRRFERIGNLDDLENAIQQHQTAVHTTSDSDPAKPACLNNLGTSLQTRFEQLGRLNDIEDAIVQLQQAVDLTPDTDPDKPSRLTNLGNALHTRFLHSGDIADIDGAIAQRQLAVRLTSDDHPSKSRHLSNLGSSLYVRFTRLENLADLENAIKSQQRAVSFTPDSHSDKPALLNNLGTSLSIRFRRLGNRADIDHAILQYQKAVNLTPSGHPAKPIRLTNLGASLLARFRQFGSLDDIDNAIVQLRIAVDLTPDSHSNKPSYLGNLGASLGNRFIRLGNLIDLENLIKTQEQALELTPKSHSDRATRLLGLGLSFEMRFNRFHNVLDAEVAISHFSAAATSPDGPPAHRFNAADSWIKLASHITHDSLLAAYGCSLDLMPLVAWLGLPMSDRHQHLIKIGGIARDAAAAAISGEQYDKALEWLDQGRSIVWTQILQLRTPVDLLRQVNPDLADRLLRVSRLLDRGPQSATFSDREISSTEDEGRRYRALTAEWESTINQVRSLPNFENFLRPPSLSQLAKASHNGPVVTFNIAKTRCDALALLPGLEDVIHIPLPNVTSERITELRDELKDHLYSSGIRMRDTRAAMKFTDDSNEESCKRVLAELWNKLVKPVLDALAFSPYPDVLPRIWWCATGPLAFLPIHAAGIYGPDSGDSQISNYVISSYAPTLSTLLDPPKSSVSSSFSLLSVIQPSAPGASSILNTKQELEYIRHHTTGRDHVVLEGAAGTKRRVTRGMEECNWLHLACHGIQVPDEPTKSALLLEDGHLTLEEIIRLDLPHAEFAFLSACQTTTGDENLSEEAVHIAGGMLLAGYRSVVATMWSIQDELAPMVTDEFYRHIMKEGERPNHRKAAEALHMSVQKLRQQPGVQLTDWIPFVHLGV